MATAAELECWVFFSKTHNSMIAGLPVNQQLAINSCRPIGPDGFLSWTSVGCTYGRVAQTAEVSLQHLLLSIAEDPDLAGNSRSG